MFKPKVWLGLIVLFLLPAAQALEVERVAVHSVLGEPLHATVHLRLANSKEGKNLMARLSDTVSAQEARRNPDVARQHVWTFLMRKGNAELQRSLEVRSAQNIDHLFVNLPVMFQWEGGQIGRDIAFLIDPADRAPLEPASPAEEMAPKPAASNTTEPPQNVIVSPTSGGHKHQHGPVASGETLHSIALQWRPHRSVSLDAMKEAIYQANPQAFSNGHNSLKTGSMLVIPEVLPTPEHKADETVPTAAEKRSGGTKVVTEAAPPPEAEPEVAAVAVEQAAPAKPAAKTPVEPEPEVEVIEVKKAEPVAPVIQPPISPEPVVTPTGNADASGRQHGPVAKGETLRSIALKWRPHRSVSVADMQAAIYRANPQAFESGYDSLKAGSMLVIPSDVPAQVVEDSAPQSAAPIAEETRPAPVKPAAPAEPPTNVAPAQKGDYGPVAQGETLRSIALKWRPHRSVSVADMQAAIYRANPQAFDEGYDSLKAGSMLVIPGDVPASSATAAPLEMSEPELEALEPRPAEAPSTAKTRRPAAGGEYGPVAAGETLWSIGLKWRPHTSVSMEQVLESIYLANPQAFDGGYETLKAGSLLTIPSEVEMRASLPSNRSYERTYSSGLSSSGQDEPSASATKQTKATTQPAAAPTLADARPVPKAAPPKVAPVQVQPKPVQPAPMPVTPQPHAAEVPKTSKAPEPMLEKVEVDTESEASADEDTTGAMSNDPEPTVALPSSTVLALLILLVVVLTYWWYRRRRRQTPVPAAVPVNLPAMEEGPAEPEPEPEPKTGQEQRQTLEDDPGTVTVVESVPGEEVADEQPTEPEMAAPESTEEQPEAVAESVAEAAEPEPARPLEDMPEGLHDEPAFEAPMDLTLADEQQDPMPSEIEEELAADVADVESELVDFAAEQDLELDMEEEVGVMTDDSLAGTDDAEFDIKLDLARSYLEMQEPDLAKGLLEEVQVGGNDAQREQAEQLLKGIS